MTELCTICQHAKVQAINAALDARRHPNIVRAQFHLNPEAFAVHLAHRAAPAQVSRPLDTRHDLIGNALSHTDMSDLDTDCLCYWCEMSGYQRLLRAWAEANMQEKERFVADTRTFDMPF